MSNDSDHKIPWRDYLDDEERALVEDAEAKRRDWEVAAAMRSRIVNKAIQRAKYAAKKETADGRR